jgi:hypothetical protein
MLDIAACLADGGFAHMAAVCQYNFWGRGVRLDVGFLAAASLFSVCARNPWHCKNNSSSRGGGGHDGGTAEMTAAVVAEAEGAEAAVIFLRPLCCSRAVVTL